jgi:hypothetical protein
MAYPSEYTVFSEIPPDYPESYSELSNAFFVWHYENRTLTEDPCDKTIVIERLDNIEDTLNEIINENNDNNSTIYLNNGWKLIS